ncbi:MAG: hypothetical protein WAL71_13040 [Terriglobales bacterium]
MGIGYSTILILAAVVALGCAAVLSIISRGKHRAKACSQCGKRSSHGYSRVGEKDRGREIERSETVPLCVDCLLKHLDEDYCTYDGRAVVVQPVAELPCYVFRPKQDWGEAVKNDLDSILAGLDIRCSSCGNEARYAWVNALEPGPVAKLPTEGIRNALLNGARAHPVALCARCTLRRIEHSLRAQEGGYLEICGPYGSDDGVVSGMGY